MRSDKILDILAGIGAIIMTAVVLYAIGYMAINMNGAGNVPIP